MEQEDFSSLSKKKLKKLINETQDVLDQLKTELKHRKEDKQHDEIDHLEEYFEDASHNLSNLKLFIKKVFSEIRKEK
ncbi:hypothetical protein MNBD_ALPHA01-2283 [hydrothermal vent metagenome]|uniref:Uncharacterized protein n=1 Tax=hydrothermal vent metagenome TaxID=652676 RepID=A0A3B0T0H8_9ZZZZ